ncbi:hypothetical protein GHT06_022124 [Daphnia sinensis]|uniref:Uncharacterized protein n=1 Tax=Daphnia sinensis TaxID=1820382 RepID=A0AAD5PND5_9CRUS|nr:hypothetical protein GHT06_022124 [Daphnia sinensis]
MMESNSPGQSTEDEKQQRDARRARSRSRTRSGLSSRVSFFESGAQSRKRSTSQSFERMSTDHSVTIDTGMSMEDSVFDQAEVDQLEREITERRQRLSRRDDEEERQRRPAVSLRRVVSPVRVEPISPSPHQVVNQQFATEVYISSWTERTAGRTSDAIQVASPPIPPPRDVSQPPWRLARRSEPTTPDSGSRESPFPTPTTPTSAFTKYQEWRARRLTSAETAEPVVPWRKQQQARKDTGQTSPFGEVLVLRRPSQEAADPSASRKNSQLPPWYSEYRTASLSQTASRMVEGFRVGGIKTHYDFHITQIKGELSDVVFKSVRDFRGTRVF